MILFNAQFFGQFAKQDGKGGGDKLHQQECANEHQGAKTQVGTKSDRHGDDGTNAVGIHKESQQKEEQVAEMGDTFQGVKEALETNRNDIHIFFALFDLAFGFAHMTEDGDGKDQPPNRHAGQAEAHHQACGFPFGHIGHQFGTKEDHDHIDEQKQPAADVAHGIATRGYLVNLILISHMRQQTVVKHERASKADGAENVKDTSQQPVGRGDYEEHEGSGYNPQPNKEGHEFFLGTAEVGNGAQHRADEGSDETADGDRVTPQRQGLIGGDEGAKIIGQDGAHDRGSKGGVAPVIHRPGPDGFLL